MSIYHISADTSPGRRGRSPRACRASPPRAPPPPLFPFGCGTAATRQWQREEWVRAGGVRIGDHTHWPTDAHIHTHIEERGGAEGEGM